MDLLNKNINSSKYKSVCRPYGCEMQRYVTLVAGMDQKRYRIPREELVGWSPYFRALIGPNSESDDCTEIVLKEIDGRMLEHIVNFRINGRCPRISCVEIDALMTVASNLEMNLLKMVCADYKNSTQQDMSYINPISDIEDAVKKLTLTKSPKLRAALLRSISEDFESLPMAKLVKLDEENFAAILAENGISAAETTIFDRLMQWLEHDEVNRSPQIASLAPLIRLEHLPYKFLRDVAQPFLEKHGCAKLIKDEFHKRARRFAAMENCSLQYRGPEPQSTHRFSTQKGKLYCAVWTGENSMEIHASKFKRDDDQYDVFEAWYKMRSVSFEMDSILHTVHANGKLFVFGAGYGTADRIKMESYDLDTGDKKRLRELADIGFMCCAPFVVGKYVYVIGKSHEELSDQFFYGRLERFDTEQNVWEKLASLPIQMKNLSAIESNGLIYVFGEFTYFANFWCYDVNRHAWTEKTAPIAEALEPTVLFRMKQRICVRNACFGFQTYDTDFDRWNKLDDDKEADPNYKMRDDKDLEYSDDSERETDESGDEDDFDFDSDSYSDDEDDESNFQILQAIDFKGNTFGFRSNSRRIEFVYIRSSQGDLLPEVDSFDRFLEPNSKGKSFHLFIR